MSITTTEPTTLATPLTAASIANYWSDLDEPKYYSVRPFCENVFFSEGMNWLRTKAHCLWLITDAAIFLESDPAAKKAWMIEWKLTVHSDQKATLIATAEKADETTTTIYSKEYSLTDFPLPELTFWSIAETPERIILLLPAEN